MEDFRQIEPWEIKDNPFTLIGDDWMLITAGLRKSFNTMTASWGGLGVLWDRKVAICVIRPGRYTHSFMEKSEYYTLSFFSRKHKDALTVCGSKSGRDVDKVKEAGLTPVFEEKTIFFREARLVLECRKIYTHRITPAGFFDPTLERCYPQKDYHTMFVGELVRCLSR